MRGVKLTQGQVAIVDDTDYEELSQFKWHATWSPRTRSYYAARGVHLPFGKWTKEWMHRRILYDTPDEARAAYLEAKKINHPTAPEFSD